MLAIVTKHNRQWRPRRKVVYLLSSLTLLWAFVLAIDATSLKLDCALGHVIYKAPKLANGAHAGQPAPLWIVGMPQEPRPVHTSFLLFDFKQNLRRWPNVAGDISRSPPFFLTL
jgi:hypothetical protein